MFKKKQDVKDVLADRLSHDEYVTQKNKKSRAFLWILTTSLLLVIGLGLIGVYLSLTHPFFHVEYVDVRGNHALTDEEIVQAIGIPEGQNVFLANTTQMEEFIKPLPGIISVDVKKVLPNSLLVTVVEEFDLGYIDVEDGYLIVGGDLLIKRHEGELPEGTKNRLIKISNARYETLAIDNLVTEDRNEQRFLRDLIDRELYKITREVDFGSEASSVRMVVNSNTIVEYGRPEDNEYKFMLIEKLIVDTREKGLRAKEIILTSGVNPVIVTD